MARPPPALFLTVRVRNKERKRYHELPRTATAIAKRMVRQ